MTHVLIFFYLNRL